MKNKAAFILVLLIVLVTNSCKEYPYLLLVETEDVTDIGATGSTATANIIDVGEAGLNAHGWCYSTNPEPTISNEIIDFGAKGEPGIITHQLFGLEPNTAYYVRPYISSADETVYGEAKHIETLDLVFEITTPAENDVLGRAIAYDIEWNSNVNDPLLIELYKGKSPVDTIATELENTGSYSWTIDEEQEGGTYQIKISSVANDEISALSEQFSLSEDGLPIVITGTVSDLAPFTATVSGQITNFGTEDNAIQHGHCWSKQGNPTISSNKTTLGAALSTTSFSSNLTGLEQNKTYYVRAYATSSTGTGYGETLSFKTIKIPVPELTTNAVTDINYTSATTGGNVTSDNGYPVTARGVIWSTQEDPTLDNNEGTIESGAGTGNFTSSLDGLLDNTTYYVRAYATSSVGTGYGPQISFTTLIPVPEVTTNAVTDISYITATTGGNVTSDNGYPVTARGVIWSTQEDPTLNNNEGTIENGTGTGSYTNNLYSLTENTTYYMRAYAINSIGTAYGQTETFSTLDLTDNQAADCDGNIYNTVTIGTQTWFAENLATTKYNDGINIPLVTDFATWENLSTPGYCWYENDQVTYGDTYGALYNWYSVNTSKLCPTGWHVPSDNELKILEMNLGMSQTEADKEGHDSRGTNEGSKLAGNATLWTDGVLEADAEFGSSNFKAMPGGINDTFSGFGYVANSIICYWWSVTESSIEMAYRRAIENSKTGVRRYTSEKTDGLSVRCLKD